MPECLRCGGVGGRHDCPDCSRHVGLEFGEPKTASGARVIELDAGTVGVSFEQRLRQDADRHLWGSAYSEHGLVFARPNGEPLAPDRVTKRFSALCAEAGVRKIRLHDLRHGAASLQLAAVSTWPSCRSCWATRRSP
jgi:integrase